MIKILAAAQRHPTNRSLPDFQRYWAETHGPMFASTAALRRYVQHLTLPEAYDGTPPPTFDGASMFWYDDYEPARAIADDAESAAQLRAVLGFTPQPARSTPAGPDAERQLRLARATLADDAQLFDRGTAWPQHHRRAYVVARERVIVDGPTAPTMVKAIFVAAKHPGLGLEEFFHHWEREHGRLAARVPGLRRYVQNHGLREAYPPGGQSHDGWSELWFDDLAALRAALASPEWNTLLADGADLFAQPGGTVVARERLQKDEHWTYHDWGVGGMTDDELRARLRTDGYTALAADPQAPERLRRAAAAQALAVWTSEHLVTIDESDIDVRPG